MTDHEIRRIIEFDYPNFPPYLLTAEEFQLRLNAVYHLKDYSFVNHARQQCMVSEAFAAKARGEPTDYLYQLAHMKAPKVRK
jgi:hypothetical protein